MRNFIDLEFYERPAYEGGMISIISLGIVNEDGDALYLENSGFDWNSLQREVDARSIEHGDTPEWLLKNVWPHLSIGGTEMSDMTRWSNRIRQFCGPGPEFWGYYSAYDWVAFCWIFGRMLDLPRSYPMYCRDIKQVMDDNGLRRSDMPEQPDMKHNALADAEWNRLAYLDLRSRGLVK